MIEAYSTELLWIVIVGLIIAFVLSFAIGANDVANSFGTSVGSGVLTFRQACILGTIFETLGAILVGFKVSDTMRKSIINVAIYENQEKLFMLGCLSALASSACWLLIATFLKLPISTTHSVVGAIVGFSLVARGSEGIAWKKLTEILFSWVASPIASGIVSALLFYAIKKFILQANDPFRNGLISLPIFYGSTTFINVASIVFQGPELLYMHNLKPWMAVAISLGIALLVAVIVQFFVVPRQRKKILQGADELEFEDITWREPSTFALKPLDEDLRVSALFSFLQILTAIFGSFAHGGNDVGNAIGPVIALYVIFQEGSVLQKAPTPIWLLIYGGVGMSIGLWVYGRRVIETIGTDLTKITPSTGFVVEIGSALTVLCCSKIGMPISTTHCKVGSIVVVGFASGRKRLPLSGETVVEGKAVDWTLFGNIIKAWIFTVPVTLALSAAMTYFLIQAVAPAGV